jgi:hypothetical protein
MKTMKKRPALNEVFKQFQRLPEWPINRAHEANQLSEKPNDAKGRSGQSRSRRQGGLLRKFQLFVNEQSSEN